MNVQNIYNLVNMNQGNHLLDAETVIIPSNTQADDELTAEKVRELLDMAWSIIDQRNAKKGLSRTGDRTVQYLTSAFNAWVKTTEVETTDIWK